MKQIISAVVLSAVLTLANFAQTTSAKISKEELAKQELMRLTNEISRASIERDAATLERLMDDNFILYGAGGKSFGKAALIKLWTARKTDSQNAGSSTPSEFQVNLYGCTAIVFSTITDVETGAGNVLITTKTKAFDVWQKNKKGWRWIASRETLLTLADQKE